MEQFYVLSTVRTSLYLFVRAASIPIPQLGEKLL